MSRVLFCMILSKSIVTFLFLMDLRVRRLLNLNLKHNRHTALDIDGLNC